MNHQFFDGQKSRASLMLALDDYGLLRSRTKLNAFECALHFLLNMVFRRRDIVIGGELYLRRWFTTPRNWAKRGFLHCILRADDQNVLHDHPWPFTSFILARGYEEKYVLHCTCHPHFRICSPGQRHQYLATHTHAVAPLTGPAWTFVVARQSHRTWGFHTPKGWVDWRTYLGLPPNTPDHPEDIKP